MQTADPQQLRALVAAVVTPDERRRVVAVRAAATWPGPEVLDGPTPIRVVPCPSPLAVRAAVVDHGRPTDGSVLALLTPCGDHDLGLDLVAQLAKGRVLPMDPYSAVLALFGAKVLDPTLVRDERWMLDELIALAPVGGWPSGVVTNGVLDVDTAWNVWHDIVFPQQLPTDLRAVLQIAADPAVSDIVAGLDDDRRRRLATRWAGGAAPVGLLIDLIANGHGPDLAPLGIAAGVLWAVTDDPVLADDQRLGRARLETLYGRDLLDVRSAANWLAAARPAAAEDTTVLDRAEQLLVDSGVAGLAILSDDLVGGFDRRTAAVVRAVDGADLDRAEDELGRLRRHRLASSRPQRVMKADAAFRVARRAAAGDRGEVVPPPTFVDAVLDYANDGSWIDEARLLLAEGDELPDVAAVYARLGETLDAERRAGDLAFAHQLAEWSRSEPIDDERIVPLEHVLDQVVADVAKHAPVLVVVCDGVGLPVAHQLIGSLTEYGWARAMPSDRSTWPVGVALLPTVTSVSRTSLLVGARLEGNKADEATGFAAHPALRRVSPAGRPPQLFHGSSLIGASGYALADDVQAAVADPDQTIVGVVINTVDDHLLKGQQIKVSWGVETMGPLAALLEAARDAGRVVVLTADHGHVIHGQGANARPPGDGEFGERWRSAPPAAADDEVVVSGPRVLKPGEVVLPADDRIRYAGHKHGYHGGACPQEVLVPVEVLARTLPSGWSYRPLPKPEWWTGHRDVEPATVTQPAAPVAPPPAQPTLFEPEPVTAQPMVPAGDARTFGRTLTGSARFIDQRRRTARSEIMSDERIARYVDVIVQHGGTIPLSALAERTGEPADQLRMSLNMVRRLLNFDGTEVLAISGNADVSLNVDLAAIQFDIPMP